MTAPDAAAPRSGRGPLFWAGIMLGAYGLIAGLVGTGAIEGVTVYILMFMPAPLMIPMMRAASRRIDEGGAGCLARGGAQKRYVKRVATFTILYLIAIGLMTYVENTDGAAQSLRTLFAVLPGFAIIGVFWAIARLIVEEQDEFMRMLVVRQSLIATGFALSGASVWGFLESADLVPHLDAYWWAVAWFVGLFVGAVVNRVEYGTWGAV